jgi:hypothetical protein
MSTMRTIKTTHYANQDRIIRIVAAVWLIAILIGAVNLVRSL